MRVVAVKGTKTWSEPSWRSRMANFSFARTTIDRPSGVSSAREASWGHVGQLLLAVAAHGKEVRGHPVAQRDRPRLVEEEHLHVAGRLDGPAAHGEDVALDQSVHPGDTDRGEQGANRRRDETDQQRHQG